MSIEIHPAEPCARCADELYFVVRVSHTTMGGSRVLGLCPRCDAADDASQELLAWFAIHGQVDVANAAGFGAMADRWVEARQRVLPGVSEGQNADDEDAWRRGEYD